ncbi:MAG: sterol desaturase family protein [Bacteroidetes bacterium]|nr:sterol desaturase family protein [Bacteroidota bacterium]MDA1121233.1 sterol desaturase family protein [Bacteroidota bacterium]
MDDFLSYFELMPTWQKLVWIAFCLIIAWILEKGFPLFKLDYKKLKHDGVNLIFLSFTMVINVVVGISSVGIFFWIDQENIGLLNMIVLPVWAELLIAVIFLDFMAQYLVHFLLHRIKWMWKFHMVHHSDTKVDATTGTRLHPGDYLFREIFGIGTAVMIGIPVSYYVFYRIMTIFFTYLTHANFQFPPWIDKAMSTVFISPNMHKFHHHFERPWTDTNFGNIFSFWDRIFGTMVYDDPKKIKYGLDVLDGNFDENIGYQLRIPVNGEIKTDY